MQAVSVIDKQVGITDLIDLFIHLKAGNKDDSVLFYGGAMFHNLVT